MNLAEFLLARIAEDEDAAKCAARGGAGQWGSWNRSWDVEPYRDLADESAGERIARLSTDLDEHVARHDPARVLAECDAKRRIVELLNNATVVDDDGTVWIPSIPTTDDQLAAENTADAVLRLLALPFADHPDYDPSWRP